MSGSESRSEQETEGSSTSETGRPSLADFLAPPRSRNSAPAPAPADEAATHAEAVAAPVPPTATPAVPPEVAPVAQTESAPVAQAEVAPAAAPARDATLSAAETLTPTEPTKVSDVSPAPVPAAALRATEPRPSGAAPSSDAGARSLIPVATSAASDAPIDDLDGDFHLPGAGPPWSSASVRRVTFVALLAAAAAVPAWVVFRARSVDVQARSEAAKPAAASVGPSTLAPAREIEADEDPANAEPAAIAVPVDPVKGVAARREARRLLEAGQIEPGVAAARSAIALNPADPESYVLLAAGLQDMGRWAESREVFSRCIHKSNNTINAECVYFATSVTSTNR